jgi:hypothetical protein
MIVCRNGLPHRERSSQKNDDMRDIIPPVGLAVLLLLSSAAGQFCDRLSAVQGFVQDL